MRLTGNVLEPMKSLLCSPLSEDSCFPDLPLGNESSPSEESKGGGGGVIVWHISQSSAINNLSQIKSVYRNGPFKKYETLF